jgi:hypothetical protein
MKVITKSAALEALNEVRDEQESFSIVSGPDRLGSVSIFSVLAWDGENVEDRDVMFYWKNGKVKVYEGA